MLFISGFFILIWHGHNNWCPKNNFYSMASSHFSKPFGFNTFLFLKLLQFWTIRNSPWITGIGSEDIFILLTLCSSEIHLFYNLQLFYWHFLEILWLFIFQLFYNYFFHLLKPLDWWMCFYILQALWSGSWLVEENISWRLGGQQVLDFWNFLSSPNHLGHAL